LIIQYKDEFISFSTHSDQTKRFAIRDGAETIVADSLVVNIDPHVWTLQFMTITKSSSGQFVVRANDQKTFFQMTVSFAKSGVAGGVSKPFIDIKFLEMSPNYNGLLKGLCGNMDG
jgi:hypothetical protein